MRKKGYKHTEETKKRIGKALKGNKNCLGRPCSEITRKKIGKANAEKVHQPHTEETKRKISEIRKGLPHPHKGHRITEAIKRKISKANKGKLSGEKHPLWKGGKRKVKNYWLIYMPEHPFANCQNCIYEHRYMAECQLGRFLNPEEIIHHIDGNSENNLPENLYLFPYQSTHSKYERSDNKLILTSNL